VWSAFAITGLCCGFAAFIIDFLVEELVLFKWEMS
jgi:H+/Cl- antiporter ClcA